MTGLEKDLQRDVLRRPAPELVLQRDVQVRRDRMWIDPAQSAHQTRAQSEDDRVSLARHQLKARLAETHRPAAESGSHRQPHHAPADRAGVTSDLERKSVSATHPQQPNLLTFDREAQARAAAARRLPAPEPIHRALLAIDGDNVLSVDVESVRTRRRSARRPRRASASARRAGHRHFPPPARRPPCRPGACRCPPAQPAPLVRHPRRARRFSSSADHPLNVPRRARRRLLVRGASSGLAPTVLVAGPSTRWS